MPTNIQLLMNNETQNIFFALFFAHSFHIQSYSTIRAPHHPKNLVKSIFESLFLWNNFFLFKFWWIALEKSKFMPHSADWYLGHQLFLLLIFLFLCNWNNFGLSYELLMETKQRNWNTFSVIELELSPNVKSQGNGSNTIEQQFLFILRAQQYMFISRLFFWFLC